MNKIWIFLFFLLAGIFLLRYAIVGQAVYGDGIYYWAYTRSLYFDHDLSFFNEMEHSYSHSTNNETNEQIHDRYTVTTEKGLAANRYPPGAPLSWFPLYILADGTILFLKNFGITLAKNGYSDIYQTFVGLENILFVISGLIVLFSLLKQFFSHKIAILTTLFLLFATNLFYYGSIDVINSHPFSFLVSTLYFYFWLRNPLHRSLKNWFLLGILLGILTSIRTQDVVLGLVLLAEIVAYYVKKYDVLTSTKQILLTCLGFLIGFLPQLIVWSIVYGTLWKSPYLGQHSFDLTHPHILGVLLNSKTGMIYFSPVFIISLFGLWLFGKRNFFISTTLLITFILQFYVISCWSGWQEGEAYGTRMFISLLPAFSIGIATLIQYLLKHMQYAVVIFICLLFVTYNAVMIGIFQFYIQENSFIGSENTQQMILNRLHLKI